MSMVSIVVAAALAGLLAGFCGGWQVQAWRHDANELHRQQQAAQKGRELARRMDVAAEGFQGRQQAANEREAAIQPEVIRVISKPVYLERCLDDDGMRILSDDARASNARRGLAPALPGSAAAR